MSDKSILETATFGAGCFWGVEQAFFEMVGVKKTAVGYMGGTFERPTYKDVCSDKTGHAEVTQISFDPSELTYEKLLEKFWDVHDPTQKNRQGPDVGSQYRSVIFYHTPEQERMARESKEKLEKSGKYERYIETAIEPAKEFWRAEEYHQKYIQKTGKKIC